jgi:hypothetical protein
MENNVAASATCLVDMRVPVRGVPMAMSMKAVAYALSGCAGYRWERVAASRAASASANSRLMKPRVRHAGDASTERLVIATLFARRSTVTTTPRQSRSLAAVTTLSALQVATEYTVSFTLKAGRSSLVTSAAVFSRHSMSLRVHTKAVVVRADVAPLSASIHEPVA